MNQNNSYFWCGGLRAVCGNGNREKKVKRVYDYICEEFSTQFNNKYRINIIFQRLMEIIFRRTKHFIIITLFRIRLSYCLLLLLLLCAVGCLLLLVRHREKVVRRGRFIA